MWTPTEEDKEHLSGDFFRASRGRFAIQVKWAETSSEFYCTVILDNNEATPIEELKTQDPHEMMNWSVRQMKEIAKRSPPS